MDPFPAEITSDIFSRLPVQSLLRARSSCRGVRDFTHDPFFVDKHLKFWSQRNLNLIITDNKCREGNLKTNKVPPPVSMLDRPGDIVIGFGVVPMTKKYKVLAIVDFPLHGDFNRLQQKVFVYTLGDTTWKQLKDNSSVLRFGQSACKAFANGALHWVSDAKLIVSFNMDTEEFSVIPRPELELGCGSFTLRAFQGKLMILNTSFGDRIEIWVMKNYGVAESWTHSFTVYEEHIGRNIRDVEIVCFLQDWEVLMVYDHRALLRYNLQTASVVEVINIDSLPERFHAIAHVGTLVSPLVNGTSKVVIPFILLNSPAQVNPTLHRSFFYTPELNPFPDGISSKIPSKLSVKSVLRAKRWSSVIRDLTRNPTFVDEHKKFSSQRNPNLIDPH
ncbi:hypothetical protein RHSIM_Rhsim06G0171400 [Rhododendron simsii]|uniref:F-box domain-containing protein n=1 Tax=Rhododendron simsii TaxID=118357 RepID=A0A834GTQ2_RHOSS|nr:hypothetical protein RHSIM_Rhsim06G0171400 [Rhododendron simsii]